MARYQIVFKNAIGDHTMLVDDPTPAQGPFEYVHQSLAVGKTVKINGGEWVVIRHSVESGMPRFVCEPIS